jgi:DNA invertase Pin-like site-specific DNA recombinase
METELLKIGAAYVRVSDERQDEYSPDSQLKKIREYAAKEGYLIPDEYVFYDDGISGKSVRRRDDFNRMIAMAKEKNHLFDIIYVWKFSRFARNQEQSILYKNLLQKNGVSVKSVSEPLPEGHFSTLIERIIEWMDEFYLINLKGEVTRGMTERMSRGEPVIPAPFGYKNADKTYLPDEESGSAQIVREIFERYANGDKQREIAISLGQRGVRTKRGNLPENRWVDYILWNPCYIGKQRWSPDGGKAVCNRDYFNEKIQVWDGNWQPLISQELWDKVQALLLEQKKAYPKHAKRQQPIDYMLKGLVRCSACGGALAMANVVSGKNKTRTMQCCNYSRGTCTTSHSVLLPKIETAFLEGLEKAIANKQFTIMPPENPRREAHRADYDKLISVEERRLARAKDAYLNEIDTLEQYKQSKEEITAKIEELKAKRDKDTVREIDVDDFTKKVVGIVDFCKRADVSEAAKNEALHNIISKVVFEKAKGNLAIYFHEIKLS